MNIRVPGKVILICLCVIVIFLANSVFASASVDKVNFELSKVKSSERTSLLACDPEYRPSLLSPADRSENLNQPITFRWTEATDALEYQVKFIDDDGSMYPGSWGPILPPGTTSYTTSLLDPGEKYLWVVIACYYSESQGHVRCHESCNGSDNWRFSVSTSSSSGGGSGSTGGSGSSSSPTSTPIPTPYPTAVPIVASTPELDGSIKHIVRGGQYLSGIASAYEVPLETLYELNNFDQNTILYIGDSIIIKKADPTSTPIPPTSTPIPPSPTPTMIPPTNTSVPDQIIVATNTEEIAFASNPNEEKDVTISDVPEEVTKDTKLNRANLQIILYGLIGSLAILITVTIIYNKFYL